MLGIQLGFGSSAAILGQQHISSSAAGLHSKPCMQWVQLACDTQKGPQGVVTVVTHYQGHAEGSHNACTAQHSGAVTQQLVGCLGTQGNGRHTRALRGRGPV